MSKQNLLSKKLLSHAITSDDLLGKDVLDQHGVLIGVTNKVLIDPNSIQILGVSIDKGFLKSGLVVGADFIDEVTSHAVFLSITPGFQIRGMHVFDVDGALLGVVDQVALTDDYENIQSITVKKHRFSRSFEVSGTAIDYVDQSVMLRVKKSEL